MGGAISTRGARVCWTLLAATLMLAFVRVGPALADGDPASDVLLAQNAYYPYQPTVSPALEAALNKLLGAAEHTHLPLKVAVIRTPEDLGADPSFFGHPQAYAQFLDREISFNDTPPLLVVMPAGFGVAAAGPASALAGHTVDAAHSTDGLVRSAIAGAGVLLHEHGTAAAQSAVPATSTSSSGPPAVVLFAVPVGLLVLGGAFAMARDKRGRGRGGAADGAGEE